MNMALSVKELFRDIFECAKKNINFKRIKNKPHVAILAVFIILQCMVAAYMVEVSSFFNGNIDNMLSRIRAIFA